MSAKSSKVVLYSTWSSSCAYRVRICLALKGIPYDVVLAKPATKGYEMKVRDRELNPTKYVPVLQIDGHVLIESLAIMQYLEETRPEPSLMPRDFFKRAQVRAICDIIASGIQPLQNSGPLKLLNEYTDGKKGHEWAQNWIKKGFEALEKFLTESAGTYCVGNEITLADCCLLPQVRNGRIFDIDLKPYPTIVRIDSLLQRNSAFREAHPTLQVGFPDEMRSDPNFILSHL